MPLTYTTVPLDTATASTALPLSVPEAMALSYAPGRLRGMYLSLFALDARLRRFVAETREPLLTQIKLAWWREQIAGGEGIKGGGEPVLALIKQHWSGEAVVLGDLVTGYELLLGDKQLAPEDYDGFLRASSAVWERLAHMVGERGHAEAAGLAAQLWTRAWLANEGFSPSASGPAEKPAEQMKRQASRLPRPLRPMAVLRVLANRSLLQGTPLLEGAGSLAAVLRAGFLGR